jgi:hypothetical protein
MSIVSTLIAIYSMFKLYKTTQTISNSNPEANTNIFYMRVHACLLILQTIPILAVCVPPNWSRKEVNIAQLTLPIIDLGVICFICYICLKLGSSKNL